RSPPVPQFPCRADVVLRGGPRRARTSTPATSPLPPDRALHHVPAELGYHHRVFAVPIWPAAGDVGESVRTGTAVAGDRLAFEPTPEPEPANRGDAVAITTFVIVAPRSESDASTSNGYAAAVVLV